MIGAKWWLVCYDVHDPARLRKCAKHLEGYGQRMQESVFRLWLTKTGLEKLRWELTEMLDPVDEVMLVPLCPNCVEGICTTHDSDKPPDWPEEPKRHLIV